MPRFPFGSRPAPRQVRRTPQPPPEPQDQTAAYGDIIRNASFTPELSFLLSMTLKDGMKPQTMMEMLKNIEPLVSASDREAIHSIFNARQMAEQYRRNPPVVPPVHSGTGLNAFSRLTRQKALLDVLSRYANPDTRNMMNALAQSASMQENFERMTRRMEKLRNMNMSSPDQMFEALSMFMPQEEQNKFRNMQNMMRMMGSMKNFKPEDMFKFMGNMGGMGGMGGMGNMGNMGNMGGDNFGGRR